MAKVKVYNVKGKETGSKELKDDFFAITPNIALIHQAVETQMANARLPLAHTKERGEVSGGGRKPWRQKGTGRARHGSIRSPLWVGGAVTFGPRKNRNWKKSINKKMKRRALYMCLSDKVMEEKLLLLDKLELAEAKTKDVKEILKALPVDKKVLIVLDKQDQNLVKATNNLKNVKVILADSLNCVDLLNYPTVLMLEPAVEIIEKTYKL